jgi:4,5-dihydroxyphthalate decarboxylase
LTVPSLRIATRAWDHLMPLATASVRSDEVELQLDLRTATPDLLSEERVDGAETSFSRYVKAQVNGDDRLVGLPIFLMRAFRHRCILVSSDSGLHRVAELDGTRIGLTGWPDSGNTWTRAILRDAGVDLQSVHWVVGPLLPYRSNDGRYDDLPTHIEQMREGDSLVTAVEGGRLDAIMTPFMPPDFHRSGAPLRHLLDDYPAEELSSYQRQGFVPGIHLLTLRRAVLEQRPWVLGSLTELFEQSKQMWQQTRQKYADTTPWMLADIDATVKAFGGDWMPYGTKANAAMIDKFCGELTGQGIISGDVDASALFAEFDATVGAG